MTRIGIFGLAFGVKAVRPKGQRPDDGLFVRTINFHTPAACYQTALITIPN